MVVGEILVLHRLQAGDQQFRHFLDPHQPPFFPLLPVQVAIRARSSRARAYRALADHVAHFKHAAVAGPDF